MKLAPSSLCVHIYCDKEDKLALRGYFFFMVRYLHVFNPKQIIYETLSLLPNTYCAMFFGRFLGNATPRGVAQ